MRSGPCAILLTLGMLNAVASETQAQTTLRYQFKEGDKFNYVMDQKTKMILSVMGKDIETKTNIMVETSWNVLKVEGGNAQVRFKVTHVRMSQESPLVNIEVDSKKKTEVDDLPIKTFAQIVKSYASMEMSGTMMPTGEIKDLKVPEETIKALKGLPGADKLGDTFSPDQFKYMISKLILPVESISKGKIWTTKAEVKTSVGKTVTERTYTYEGPIEKNGKTLELISGKLNLKIEPDSAAPIEIKLKDLKANSTILFDNKTGRLMEMTENEKTEMQLGPSTMMVNQIIDQTVTWQLKKQ